MEYCMSFHCIVWYCMVLYCIRFFCTASHCHVPLLQRAGELPRSASSHFLASSIDYAEFVKLLSMNTFLLYLPPFLCRIPQRLSSSLLKYS